MKKIFIIIMILSCISQQVRSIEKATGNIISSRDSECGGITPAGEKTLCYIQYDYNNTATRCEKNDDKPGFICSGLIIRGTSSNLNRDFYSWNPSPASVTSGGVSFSYLRKDSNFNGLAFNYVSGFIFFPADFTPKGKDNTIKILCGYPLDAASDYRDDKGCGQYNNVAMSKPCAQQGITTASQWYDTNYEKAMGDRYNYCSFTFTSDNNSVNTSQLFDAMIKSQILLKDVSFEEQNEFRVATWEQNKADIPIEAFFYVSANASGLLSAQLDQQDFYDYFGEIIPIIEITFPPLQDQNATFNFNTADQVLP